ncbi:hypothetical protein [Nocardiopsis alborubida]|uniref:Uncharacterized protein n=1 Tax=Nocardiopsis alborubida TaxID=146802 RepID=A0A7X6RQX1_9ACTN|nr:hypothetical protein [Nocardiopsis alborubida]NKY99219.1 hypothetical protein [Nocardiopsis alborubida]
MDLLTDFLAWAWPRHLNPLSWYVRPLFFLPIAYFCWTRRPAPLALTMVAMLSSFFWFPAPEEIDPAMAGVLEMERELFTDPTWVTWATLPLVPALLGSLCAAFWYRSLGWGLVVVNGGLVVKIAWAVANSGADGLATVLPLGLAMAVVTAVVVAVARWRSLPLSLTGHRHGGRDGRAPAAAR